MLQVSLAKAEDLEPLLPSVISDFESQQPYAIEFLYPLAPTIVSMDSLRAVVEDKALRKFELYKIVKDDTLIGALFLSQATSHTLIAEKFYLAPTFRIFH